MMPIVFRNSIQNVHADLQHRLVEQALQLGAFGLHPRHVVRHVGAVLQSALQPLRALAQRLLHRGQLLLVLHTSADGTDDVSREVGDQQRRSLRGSGG